MILFRFSYLPEITTLMISNSSCFNDFYPSHVTEFLRDFMMLGFESDGRHALNARHLPPKISEPAFCNREIPTQRYGPSGITSTRTTHLCTLKVRHKLTMSQTGNPACFLEVLFLCTNGMFYNHISIITHDIIVVFWLSISWSLIFFFTFPARNGNMCLPGMFH